MKKKLIIAIIFAVLLFATFYIYRQKNNPKENKIQQQEEIIKKVSTITIDNSTTSLENIKTEAQIKPKIDVNIISQTTGNIQGIYFEVGDKVSRGQVLANIKNDNATTQTNNTQLNLFNIQNNLRITELTTQETVNQAKIGVEEATQGIENAKLSLDAVKLELTNAENNYKNTEEIHNKTISQAYKTAIVTAQSYLNAIDNALNDIDYIIDADEDTQLYGISHTLATKNTQSLIDAKNSYLEVKEVYTIIKDRIITEKNIENFLNEIIDTLELTKISIESTILVLDNTVSSKYFSEESITNQRTIFSGLENSITSTNNNTLLTINNLENVKLNKQKELDLLSGQIDSIKDQIKLSEQQVLLTKKTLEKSQSQLESTKKNQEQQILSAQTSLDNAQGQLSLNNVSINDLRIIAEISGTISEKFVENGDFVTVGQKVATISDTSELKIEFALSPEQVYKIKLGQIVEINKEHSAIIDKINPIANIDSKKVKVKATIENRETNLIAGTNININIPIRSELNTMIIPLNTLIIEQNGQYVFLAKKDDKTEKYKAQKTKIVTGETIGNKIKIKSGLKNKDILITEGSKEIEDNEIIKIK